MKNFPNICYNYFALMYVLKRHGRKDINKGLLLHSTEGRMIGAQRQGVQKVWESRNLVPKFF